MHAKLLRLLSALTRAVLLVSLRRLGGRSLHPPGHRRRWRTDVLTELLRRDIGVAVDHEPARIRRFEHPTPLPANVRRQVRLEPAEVAGVPGLWVTSEHRSEDAPRTTLLYLHGGGYCFCSSATHRALVAQVAIASQARCLALDYRLAPEHPFPAALDDALAAYRALVAGGTGPERLVLAGDSAGGGLALATLLRLRDAGEPLPRAAALLSPWVDLACRGESIDRNGPRDYLSRAVLERFAGHYLGAMAPETPSASPLYADLTGLPPLLVQAGSDETLLTEGRDLAARAETAGVEVRFREWPGQVHVFQAFAPYIPEAMAAIREIGDFVRGEA